MCGTVSDNTHCPQCGKPYTYIGDTLPWPAGQEPWCTCTKYQPYTEPAGLYISGIQELTEAIKELTDQMKKVRLEDLELCDNDGCHDGKVLSPDGDSAVVDCPVCEGRGFKLKK